MCPIIKRFYCYRDLDSDIEDLSLFIHSWSEICWPGTTSDTMENQFWSRRMSSYSSTGGGFLSFTQRTVLVSPSRRTMTSHFEIAVMSL